jgi:cell division septum initiation protein DivIVA
MADEELLRQLQKSIEQLTEEVKDLKKQLAEKQDKFPMISTTPYVDNSIPAPCRNCSNHPSNGGSGICHCTLGLTKVTC